MTINVSTLTAGTGANRRDFAAQGNLRPSGPPTANDKAAAPASRRYKVSDKTFDMLGLVSRLREERQKRTEQLQNAREAAEAQAEIFRKLQIAMQIASRIMRGDNVPQSNKEFLLKHSPGMFKLSMATRDYQNEEPENHQALAPKTGQSAGAASTIAISAVAGGGLT